MVTHRDTPESGPAGDRGQLVLIGAVAIAFVLVGLVVLFNGVVFTENVGSEGAVVDAKSSGTTSFAIEQGLGQAAHSVHTSEKYDETETGALDTDLTDTIEEFDEWQRLQTGETRGVITEVSFEGINDEGTRVVQDQTGAFTPAGSTPASWEPVSNARIDEFVLRIDPASFGTSDSMTISFDPGSPDEESITIDGVASGEVSLSGDVDGNCAGITDAADDEIIIQVTRGFVEQRPGCTFRALTNPRADETVEFSGDIDSFAGTYEFVTDEELNGGASRFDGYQSAETPNSQPHLSLIAWSADYDITVTGPTVSQEITDTEVEHYG
jgi:hypothetical protein